MSVLRRWIDRLLGLQSDVEHQVERSVRLNAAIAGAVIRAEAVADARAFAEEIAATNPEVAAAVYAAIAEHAGNVPNAPTTPCPAESKPTALPAPQPKRSPGRPRKIAPLPPADAQPGGNL